MLAAEVAFAFLILGAAALLAILAEAQATYQAHNQASVPAPVRTGELGQDTAKFSACPVLRLR